MLITRIEATRDRIVIHADDGAVGHVVVQETVPVVAEKRGRTLRVVEGDLSTGTITLARFDGPRDGLYSEYVVWDRNARVGGVRFVTDMAPELPANRQPYPQPATIKALGGTPDDVRAFGSHQAMYNVNLPAIMAAFPRDDTMAYEHDGRTYWFRRPAVEKVDADLQEYDALGLLVTMVLLNSPRHFGATGDKALYDACLHPQYDWGYPDAFVSAFDMRTEEGQGYYRAFCEFLAERYTREDHRYGRLGGVIVSNEVNSQCCWGNAGEMTVDEYAREYTTALRLAWLAGQKHCAYFRVYMSLDQLWGVSYRPTWPLRTYPARDMLDRVNAHAVQDGNFPWHVAYHPYPEDLRYSDFWHDRTADFSFGTAKITFRNIEVLPAYLAQPQFLCGGQPRRIILSEQGFNSLTGPLQQVSEAQGEAAYVLAYCKARAIRTIDLMTHHGYVDDPHEFGFNLGLRRYDPAAPDHRGGKKPIFDAVCDMDTEREPARVAKARAYIGPDVFDHLLNPPPIDTAIPDPNAPSDFGEVAE